MEAGVVRQACMSVNSGGFRRGEGGGASTPPFLIQILIIFNVELCPKNIILTISHKRAPLFFKYCWLHSYTHYYNGTVRQACMHSGVGPADCFPPPPPPPPHSRVHSVTPLSRDVNTLPSSPHPTTPKPALHLPRDLPPL